MSHGLTEVDYPSEVIDFPSGYLRPNRITSILSSVHTPSTPSGFNITVRDTQATIIARTGDAVGVIAYGTDTYDLYVYDGTSWQRYENT